MGRGKNKHRTKKEKTPAWEQALGKIGEGPLFLLAWHTSVHCDDGYPMARDDWAYVTGEGDIYLNPRREAAVGEWVYVISHCLLHLGFGHIREDRQGDPIWNAACDLVVTKFLRDSRIGVPPPDFQNELPCAVKSEEQAAEWLRVQGPVQNLFSTMTRGRPDMLWRGKPRRDYVEFLAESLQDSMRDAVRAAGGLPPMRENRQQAARYREARDWFVSSYPLLGALAASFRIVDDASAVRRLNVPVAAVSPQLQEIYINPGCGLDLDEWKFVLAHEFLHAALRHDIRLEDRDPELWNVACDYVVNGWLVEMGLGCPPEFALLDDGFKGLSAEAVYDLVLESVRQYRRENTGDLLYGDPAFWDRLDGSTLDEYYRSALRQGLVCHQERGRGYLPAGLMEEIYAVSRPPIRWDVELARWFDERFRPLERRRTYARLSRRQSSSPDIPRPAWRMEEQKPDQRTFGVLLDTSGSMDRGLLAAALGSIASYSMARDVHHVRVVFCDAAAYDQGIMAPEDIAGAVQVRGRGGTRLQPGIDLLDRDPKFPKEAPLLIITDGDCDRLNVRGREHAYLIPWGRRLPFPARGPVFKLK